MLSEMLSKFVCAAESHGRGEERAVGRREVPPGGPRFDALASLGIELTINSTGGSTLITTVAWDCTLVEHWGRSVQLLLRGK